MIVLQEHQIVSLKRLKEALQHFAEFNTDQADNEAIYTCPANMELYELPHNNGQFNLGDLRNLVSILPE